MRKYVTFTAGRNFFRSMAALNELLTEVNRTGIRRLIVLVITERSLRLRRKRNGYVKISVILLYFIIIIIIIITL